jgi:hypothetical protein
MAFTVFTPFTPSPKNRIKYAKISVNGGLIHRSHLYTNSPKYAVAVHTFTKKVKESQN